MSTIFTVLTNRVNNLSSDEANKVIAYMKQLRNELIEKAEASDEPIGTSTEIFEGASSEHILINVRRGNFFEEKLIQTSDILK
jgi:hypothetical protein